VSRFAGRTVLVTGASSGLGRATAERVASEGGRVLLVARDGGRLEQVRGSLPGSDHVARTCDVTDEVALTALVTELKELGGEVHGVFHAAGIHWLRPLQLTDATSLKAMLESHVVSSFALTRALVQKRLTAKQGCSMVWMTSAAALRGGAGASAYAAAKGALVAAVRALANELVRRAIRVNAIAAGVVRTPQSEAWLGQLTAEQLQAVEVGHLLGIGTPQQIAAVAAFLLSDDAAWITGTTLVADGGLTAH
jgi:NAD(P)-dependent dehydrogenase (short-subunit alcohol dehydrogenase family)